MNKFLLTMLLSLVGVSALQSENEPSKETTFIGDDLEDDSFHHVWPDEEEKSEK